MNHGQMKVLLSKGGPTCGKKKHITHQTNQNKVSQLTQEKAFAQTTPFLDWNLLQSGTKECIFSLRMRSTSLHLTYRHTFESVDVSQSSGAGQGCTLYCVLCDILLQCLARQRAIREVACSGRGYRVRGWRDGQAPATLPRTRAQSPAPEDAKPLSDLHTPATCYVDM